MADNKVWIDPNGHALDFLKRHQETERKAMEEAQAEEAQAGAAAPEAGGEPPKEE